MLPVRRGRRSQGEPFWVDGSLRISANKQVEFRRRLYEERLGLSGTHHAADQGHHAYFAIQIGAADYGRAYSERIPISRAILTELGVLH